MQHPDWRKKIATWTLVVAIVVYVASGISFSIIGSRDPDPATGLTYAARTLGGHGSGHLVYVPPWMGILHDVCGYSALLAVVGLMIYLRFFRRDKAQG
jgi:hypothetical protein